MNLNDFYEILKKNLDDWQLRGIFADWCFDNKELQLEKAQRFMIEYKVYALSQHQGVVFIWGTQINPRSPEYFHSFLPTDIYEKLVDGNALKGYKSAYWKVYSSLRNAEFALGDIL